MDLKNLPWWKGNTSNYFDGRGGTNQPQNILEPILVDRLQRVPPSKELVESFLDNWILKFRIFDLDSCDARLIMDIFGSKYDLYSGHRGYTKFILDINSNLSFEDKSTALVHESIHGIYRATSGFNYELEPIILDVEKKVYSSNKEFFNSLAKKHIKI